MIEEFSHPDLLHETATAGYKNPQLSPAERVDDLLRRMTLEEKVAQMLCIWREKKSILFDEHGHLDDDRIARHLPDGVGQIARLSDTNGGMRPYDMAVLANALQKYFVEHTRLGIPVIFHEECLHGLAAPDATSYPQPIGLAATFNPELLEEIFTSIAEDARSRGVHQALAPVVDVARDPRWGRVEETFGEDPYLAARMGIAAVRGFQGDASFKEKNHIIATLKHFAAHGQPESGMNCGPVNISERVLRDTFLYTFREVITKANALSVMPSYNEIDGIPSHANTWLLRDILRNEWGFQGTAVSDYFAITELNVNPEATSHWVAPLLLQKFQLGLFDDPCVDPDAVRIDARLDRERALALQAAHETITLLKNENNLLPLKPPAKSTLAVIGPNADRKLLGGYSGTPRYYTTVLQGIRERAGKDVTVLYSEGCKLTRGGSWNDDAITFSDPDEDRRSIAEAVATAQKADTVVL
ncbi:MAG: glycoside hydrolase family 3 protein, partial [Bacteroidetes bacterium]|nr:glycoside hydrolase family 3 protein [Bacteroidota bacterium]